PRAPGGPGRRNPPAVGGWAEGQKGAARHGGRRGARHRPGRRRARALASRPQPAVGQRSATPLSPDPPPGVAAPAEGHAVNSRACTLITMIAAAALLVATPGPEPAPRPVRTAPPSAPLCPSPPHPRTTLTATAPA